MEDVLEVYQRPHDPACPVVCVDETSKQLVAETRVPIKAKPGRPARHDHDTSVTSTANLFTMFAPLEVWRHIGQSAWPRVAGWRGRPRRAGGRIPRHLAAQPGRVPVVLRSGLPNAKT